jgi:hypothetical protein
MATVPDLSGNIPMNAPNVDKHLSEYMNSGAIITGSISVSTANGLTLPPGQLGNGMTLLADPTNTGIIYVGAVGVTVASGYPLSAGQSVTLEVPDASQIGYKATVSGDKLKYTGN